MEKIQRNLQKIKILNFWDDLILYGIESLPHTQIFLFLYFWEPDLKLRLFDSQFKISKVYDMGLQRYRYESLRQILNSFVTFSNLFFFSGLILQRWLNFLNIDSSLTFVGSSVFMALNNFFEITISLQLNTNLSLLF